MTTQQTKSNIPNRTVFTRDNLEILRGINSKCIDLIYLDPPFNSNRNYAAPIGSEAAGAAFKDTWELNDLDQAWHNEIADKDLALYKTIDASEHSHGKSMKSYLIMMAVRLMELKRVLRDTGSIYLHCDPTASHYLKTLMDSIFGSDNFRNEVVWKRTSGRSDGKQFGRVHETLLYYSASSEWTWNTQYTSHTDEYVAKAYRNKDELGPWTASDLTATGISSGESGMPWRGIDPGMKGNHWRTPTRGGMNDFIVENNLIPGWPGEYKTVHERLDALDAAGLVYWPERGNIPRLKRYLASAKGIAIEDIFTDISNVQGRAKENLHYPTQKPLALLERIIKASSNEGDIVLDPFCGCATACEAAEKLGRQWIGIDLSPQAINLVNRRMKRMFGDQLVPFNVTARTDIPSRTDLGPEPPRAELKTILYGEQGGFCKGCGEHFQPQHLTLDRIIPGAKGGTYHKENVQLLCHSCNSIKGDRPMEYLRARLEKEYRWSWGY